MRSGEQKDAVKVEPKALGTGNSGWQYTKVNKKFTFLPNRPFPPAPSSYKSQFQIHFTAF